ncbi:ComF family protein [Virgibacillus sp. Bac330]|uniref:ComF family protein n=1 Tax=Virgibacillus sp. Bac330 TaxID=2419841 RepID=UPI001F097EF4|nr:ComF family protein [Virgibacillus sp. Bac330]
MMTCLLCEKNILPEVTWRTVLYPEAKVICNACNELLVAIDGPRCTRCSRSSTKGNCLDCIHWEKTPSKDSLARNYSVYPYSNFMQEIITKWKYQGDYELGNVFKKTFRIHFKRMIKTTSKAYVAVPIPLSEKRQEERGFNQAAMLAEFLPIPKANYLERIGSEKQAKKSKEERMKSANPFRLKKSLNKPVVLVDDIYTTGMTLRHAARVLLEQGCPNVISFTLIRS